MKHTKLILLICICFTGCKTKQHLESHNDIRSLYSEEYLLSMLTSIEIADSIQQKITRDLSGHIVLWSKPDSIGLQYKTADIEFISINKEEISQASQIVIADTITLKNNYTEDITDKSVVVDSKESDSRIINNNLLAWIIGIIVGLGLMVILFRFFFNTKSK